MENNRDRAAINLSDFLSSPDLDWKTIRNDQDVRAAMQQVKKDAVVEDIESFLAAYGRATGEELVLDEICESPDAICVRSDGSVLGVEITNVRHSPQQAFWESTFDRRDQMDCEKAVDEVVRLAEKRLVSVRSSRSQQTSLFLQTAKRNSISW